MRAARLPVYEEAMRKYIILLTITITATACHGLNGRYRNMEKWRVIDREGISLPLRGMPLKVTEYSYPASDSLTPEKWKGRHIHFEFDSIGNLVYIDSYVDDTLIGSVRRQFDENGMQETFSNKMNGQLTVTSSRRLPDGRIKTIETQAAERPTATICRYSTDGDEVIREEYADTAAKGQPVRTAHLYYEQYYHLLKVRISTSDGNFEVDNFYRRPYEPDSTLTFAGTGLFKKLAERVIYHSDYLDNPIVVLSISKATRSVTQYSYRYDKSGNWVRRIATTVSNKVANDPKTLSTVTDREITY
jgi:hypothetical protein